ncbi:MAG: M23 family metallopeptidase [Actinobacteria bacterium]|nr:M23 family metallopeptidase [Actinomycetota bacterium]MBV9936415.1 M23 family metallopeptidase [Actinomycetota bacterium]
MKRSKPNNTTALLAALRPLLDVGLTQDQAVSLAFGRFPVGGQANFSDDWWTPRFTPVFHLHQGNDIFAAQGTPVRAPADGVLRQSNEAVGGLSAYVTIPDGTFFYMAHLVAFVTGQKSGDKVKMGEVIGFVGATGDAVGGAPHCHFEIHPKGGAATDPKPYLDQWLNDDMTNMSRILAAYLGNRPAALLATALTRPSADGSDNLFSAPSMPPESQLLWASSASPGGALHLAEAAAVEAAGTVDWPTESARQAAVDQVTARSDLQSRALLAPLTPAPLRAILGY